MKKLEALKKKIEAEVSALSLTLRNALAHAKAIGDLLIQVKAEAGRTWMDWTDKNCSFCHKTATNYVKIAKHWKDIPPESTVTEALGLLSNRTKTKTRAKGTTTPVPPNAVHLFVTPKPGHDLTTILAVLGSLADVVQVGKREGVALCKAA